MKRLLLFSSFWLLFTFTVDAQVRVESLPEPGLQPQVVISDNGIVHLVYLKGDPKACDIRYATRRGDGLDWSVPVTVNSEAGSAIAAGTIRGAQIALGKDESVQVIWNSHAGADKMAKSPLLYSRLEPGAKRFSPQQNLMGETTSLDGGASITANEKGHISVVWHAAPKGEEGESARLVWVRYSADDGRTFSPPAPLNAGQPGVCACCSLRAHLSADDTLTVLYRAATAPDERGMTIITAKAGQSRLAKLDDWRVAMCPMSSASLLPAAESLRAAWENDGRIVTGQVGAANGGTKKIGPPDAKHPVMARSENGEILIASVIGSGWSKAGRLHWEILDSGGSIVSSGDGETLPVWSYAAAYARSDGSFVVLY